MQSVIHTIPSHLSIHPSIIHPSAHTFTLPCALPPPNLPTQPPTPSSSPLLASLQAEPSSCPPARNSLEAVFGCFNFLKPVYISTHKCTMRQTCYYPSLHHLRKYLISHSFTSYMQYTSNSCGLSNQGTCSIYPLISVSFHLPWSKSPSTTQLQYCISLLTGFLLLVLLPYGPFS